MSEILLTNCPTVEQMTAMKALLDANKAKQSEQQSGDEIEGATVHWRFWVLRDGEMIHHPHGGINRAPRLVVRLTEISGTPCLTQQHLPIKVEVLEDFAGGELLYQGQDIGKAGTKLDLQCSFVDHMAEIEGATAP